MKTTNLLSFGMVKIIVISILIFSNYSVFAQCNGNVTLSTQAQINAFACASFTGNLTIRDDNNGIDNIISLDPIFVNGLQGGNIIGDVLVDKCNSLTNLQGLDGIINITGRFTISNCPMLSHFGGVNFKLQSVSSFFLFINLPNLTNVSRLVSLKSVGSALAFQYACGLQDFTPFNTLTSCPWIEFYQTTQANINAPFTGITTTNYVHLFGNACTNFNGFTNLKTLNGASATLSINSNPNLTNFNINSGLNQATTININNNPKFASCCFLLQFTNNPAYNISANAAGCNSYAQANAPPTLTACPPHRTVSTNPGTCVGSTSATSPIANDNCDLVSYNLQVQNPNGSIQNFATPTGTPTYNNIAQGVTKLTYIATDSKGNISTCFFNVTVADSEKPVLSNIPPNVTINCNDNFPSIPSPITNDNCDAAPVLTIASSLVVGNCTVGTPAETHSYTWTLTDGSGNVSTADWKVTVMSDFSFDLGAPIEICNASTYLIDPGTIGNSYKWSTGATSQAISVNSSGLYKVTVTSKNGCCYVDEKMVTFSSPPNATAMGGTLNCSATNVQIFGSSTASGVTYSWTGPGGFTSAVQNPLVTSLGAYILTVSNASGCSSTASATVTGDTDIPNVSATGGTINCSNTSVQLMGSSATSGVTYSWTGPGSYTSALQNPTVTVSGIYTLNVLSNNGCSGKADAIVVDNTTPPVITLVQGTLTCATTELELSVVGTASWTGPNGFTSTAQSITVVSPGTYAVTVTGSNSCKNSKSIDILSNVTIPNISAQGGVINCVTGQSKITGNSTTVGATYSWTGPGAFTTEIQNPIAIIAGTYTLIVKGPNGCTASQSVEVAADEDAPEVSVNDASIDCINSSATLTATSPNVGVTFMWTGPNNFTAEVASITIMEPGEYTVMAINENGCAGIATSNVAANNTKPTVSIFVNPIGCQVNDVTFVTEVSAGVSTFAWTGPSGFTSEEKEPVITEVGIYTLVVTAENGCTAMTTFEVISDSEVPDASATVEGLLTCTQNTITLMGGTTTDTVTFLWTGPDDFASNLQNPVVSQPGVYIFKVIAANGCFGQSTVEVMGDGEFPTVSATGGKINCNNSSVILLGTTNIENATFKWEGPNGFATSINNPEIDIAGEYTFTVTSPGGCTAFKTVAVTIDNQDPDLSISQGFLNCEAGVRNFRVVTNAEDPTILWTGPGNYTSSELNATYSKAGTYTILITGSNGCSSQLSMNVDFDIAYVHTLNITGNDASLEITGGTPPFVITWDNGTSGTAISNLADGEHFVKIVDGLDCSKLVEFTINTTSTIDIADDINLKVYPNPVIDELRIEWKSTSFDAKSLEIISTNGHKLKRTEIAGRTSEIFNVNDLTPGIYIIKIEGKDSVIFKKFLKM